MIIIIIKRQYRQSTNMIDAVVDDVGEWGLMFLMCAVATECA